MLRILALLLAASLAACSSPVREVVYSEDEVEVSTRAYREEGAVVPQGFQHPATLEVEPLAYALAEIEVGDLEDERVSQRRAIPLELIAPIARGLAEGFAVAGPDEELVVIATRKEKTVGVFHRRLLTTFIAVRRDDHLWLSFVHSDEPLRKDEEREERPVPERGERRMQFRILPRPGVAVPSAQTAKLAWPAGDDAPATVEGAPADRPGSGTMAAGAADEGEGGEGPPGEAAAGDPQVARELRELEEALERGEIAPIYYHRKRAELLGLEKLPDDAPVAD